MECAPATLQENREAQDEEMEALRYIYGEDCVADAVERSCEIQVYQEGNKNSAVKLTVFFPDNYPSSCPPFFEVSASWISEELREKLFHGLSAIYMEGCGEVVVFRWVEWMKEQAWLWKDAKEEEVINNSKFKVENFPATSLQKHEEPEFVQQDLDVVDKALGIVHGAPFTEKRSTFQAHLASVHSADGVKTVMEALVRNKKVAAATHNIMAYRISIPDKNVILQDYDDDGETAAGGRLLHLLQIVDALDVVVVVSRWFGGILLGPDRFKHINNAGRSLLDACGFIKDTTTKKPGATTGNKKGKRH